MGYYLRAIVATQHLLESHTNDYQAISLVLLSSGLALIPITDELLEEVDEGDSHDGFEQLHQSLIDWITSISVSNMAAYVEAEFFGGMGGQSAVVWSDGSKVFENCRSHSAINGALRLFGVQVGKHHDEFEAVGLNRHRDTCDWLADAVPKRD